MIFNRHKFNQRPDGRSQSAESPYSRSRAAFSMVEILVTVVLLTVIILGLVAMFDQTRRAFTSSFTQTDVLESGRSAAGLIAREMEQMTPAGLSNTVNFYVDTPQITNNMVFLQGMIDPNEFKTNFLQEVYFLTRNNQKYTAIGYKVFGKESQSGLGWSNGVGTLYRFNSSQIPNVPATNLLILADTNHAFPLPMTSFFATFNATTNLVNPAATNLTNCYFTRLIDGVVDFQIHAYDANGVLFTNWATNSYTVSYPLNSAIYTNIYNYSFRSNSVPAYVEVELGVLEDRTLARYNAIGGGDAATAFSQGVQQAYLSNHLGQVHIFRQRIPIRNVIPSPLAYQ